MSRRTRFFLLGLCLLFLAAAGAYVALIWVPPHPFRAQLDPDKPPEDIVTDEQGGALGTVYLLVENTTSTPIYVLRVDAHAEGSIEVHAEGGPVRTNCAFEATLSAREIIADRGGNTFVPPHSTMPMEVFIMWPPGSAGHSAKVTLEHVTLSGPKSRFVHACQWLVDKLPARWHRYIPDPRPDLGSTHVAPVEKSLPASP